MKLELWYPAKPYIITRKWGIHLPDIYAQFGFENHNGEDFQLGADKKLYSPFKCVVVKKGYQPKGGGIFVGLMSTDLYDFGDENQCNVLIDFLHLEKILVEEGQVLEIGDLIAVADNTGYSTGPHTHAQFRRCIWDGKVITFIDSNKANNSFDPTPYWNGIYAVDYEPIKESVKVISEVVKLVPKVPKEQQYTLLEIIKNFLYNILGKVGK